MPGENELKKAPPLRAGVIDIGSNSIKLIIGEAAGEEVRVLETLKNVIPIGNSTFFKGSISQETTNQVIGILEKYKKILAQYDLAKVMVIGTTAIREARNRDVFLDTVARKTGFKIEVFSVGDVIYYIDAYISHKLQKAYPIHNKNLIIAEIGAGSLDVSVMRKGFMLMNMGLSIGALRVRQLMSKLDGSREEITEAVQEYIENDFAYLKRVMPRIQIDDVILIDENYSYLQSILPNKKPTSDFFKFSQEDSKEVLAQLLERSDEDVAKTYKIPREVSDTMIAYAIILDMFFKLTENKYIYILETSLAEAVLANVLFDFELSEKYNKQNQLIAVATFLCNKYDIDLNHVQQVANLAKTLFDSLKDYLGLKNDDLLYLLLAAYLHDIGIFIHNRSHHKHSEYIISSLSLFRLTEDEMMMIACVARYHRKAPPIGTHPLYNSLSSENQILIQKLSAILRIANSLDRSHKQKISQLEVKFNRNGDVTISVQAKDNILLEKADFLEKKDLFEEITGNSINLTVKSGV